MIQLNVRGFEGTCVRYTPQYRRGPSGSWTSVTEGSLVSEGAAWTTIEVHRNDGSGFAPAGSDPAEYRVLRHEVTTLAIPENGNVELPELPEGVRELWCAEMLVDELGWTAVPGGYMVTAGVAEMAVKRHRQEWADLSESCGLRGGEVLALAPEKYRFRKAEVKETQVLEFQASEVLEK